MKINSNETLAFLLRGVQSGVIFAKVRSSMSMVSWQLEHGSVLLPRCGREMTRSCTGRGGHMVTSRDVTVLCRGMVPWLRHGRDTGLLYPEMKREEPGWPPPCTKYSQNGCQWGRAGNGKNRK